MTGYTASSPPTQFCVLRIITHQNIRPASISTKWYSKKCTLNMTHIHFSWKILTTIRIYAINLCFWKIHKKIPFCQAQRNEWHLQATAQPAREGIGTKNPPSVHTLRTVLFLQCNFFTVVLTFVIIEKHVLPVMHIFLFCYHA